MEVTSTNFNSLLPEIEDGIENCTFACIDCEFTGLNSGPKVHAFSTPCEYYSNIRRSCKDFLVVQFGLSLFRYDADCEDFKQRSYNFYIFRKPINRNVPDQRFLCQSSSIAFLINQGFDFNKLFSKGISYLNEDESKKYKNTMTDHQHQDIIPIPESVQQYIDDAKERIEGFLKSDDSELELPKCNAFFRKLIYQTYKEYYANKIYMETRLINNDRIVFVTKLKDGEHLDKINKDKSFEKLEEYENALGFSKVLHLLVKSKKLIVGHNPSLDLMHTIAKFLVPLPEDYEDFKKIAHKYFPKMLDTKYMTTIEPFDKIIKSTILKDLLNAFSTEPFQIPDVVIEEGFKGYSKSDEKDHEAGYDAYMTGLVFLSAWKYIGNTVQKSNREIFTNFDLLTPYMNKIGLAFLLDNQFINLAGKDPIIKKDHIFYLNFPADWKTNNIVQLFSPFSNVNVYWVDDCSAYVSLYRQEQAASAYKALSKGTNYTIMTFKNRQAISSGITTPLSSPAGGKRKRNSNEDLPIAKKRGSLTNVARKSLEAIEEEHEENGKKMFNEDSNWD